MNLKRLPAIAFDRDVLKLALPAYALPFLDLAAGAIGIGALAPAWFWLFGPAAGLHALLAINSASRSKEVEEVEPRAAAPGLDDIRKLLENGFTRLNAEEGLKAVEEIASEYEQLQPVLARRRVTDSVAVAQIPALANETYRQGLSVLQDALDLLQASSPAEKQRLKDESEVVEREIATLKRDPSQAGRLRIREERLASNNELLAIMNKQQERVDELLYQSDRCGASLQRTRIELAGMRADGSEEGVNAVIDTLRLTINHAKGVQDEMKRLGARSPRTT